MGQTEMVVGQRQPQLLFHPRHLFGKCRRFARQAPIVFSPGQIVALDKTRVNRGTRTGRCQLGVKRVSITKHNLAAHLYDPSFDAPLHHLGIQQVRPWLPTLGRIAPPIPIPLGLIPFAVGVQQCGGVGGQLITGKEGNIAILREL